MNDAADDVLVPAEICAHLRITRAKFYYLAARGRLEFLFKVGNEWRARRQALLDWIAANTATLIATRKRQATMTQETEMEHVCIEQLQALVSEGGLEVDLEGDDVLRIRDHESGIVIRSVLEDNILFNTVSCMVVKEDRLTPAHLRKMLDAENGISTSSFQLYARSGGDVAITLNNFCKLQTLGEEDRDDVMSCLEFLVLDVVTASEILSDLAA